MSIFPTSVLEPLVTIIPTSLESIGSQWVRLGNSTSGTLNGAASTAYPTANKAIYYPFFVSKPIVVQKLFCLNGATVSGNIDIGIYDTIGTRIVSAGSTAQSGTSSIQTFSISATEIGPGQFYLAVAMDNTTGTLFKSLVGSPNRPPLSGMASQASAFPLPATATFASSSDDFMAVIGLTTRSVV